jgi:hypothetical protein
MDETSQDVFACSVAELKVAGKYIVNHDDEEIVVFWNQGGIYSAEPSRMSWPSVGVQSRFGFLPRA